MQVLHKPDSAGAIVLLSTLVLPTSFLMATHRPEYHLKPELVEGLRKAGLACDFIHKLATGCILKHNAAGVQAQGERQEGAFQGLLCIGLDAHPLPINAEGLGKGPGLSCVAFLFAICFDFLPAIYRSSHKAWTELFGAS